MLRAIQGRSSFGSRLIFGYKNRPEICTLIDHVYHYLNLHSVLTMLYSFYACEVMRQCKVISKKIIAPSNSSRNSQGKLMFHHSFYATLGMVFLLLFYPSIRRGNNKDSGGEAFLHFVIYDEGNSLSWQRNSERKENKQNDLSGKYGQTRGINNGMEVGGNHLILLVSVLFPATMTVTFTLAVSSEHVYPVMPFMSYTGDLPVESCIFSLGLNLIAVLYIIISLLRYNQIIKFCEEENPLHVNTILRLNRNSLSWALVSSLGLSVTGSFQEVHAATVHRMGALVCTYSGFVYLWYQTIVSDLLTGQLNTKATFYLRLGLSIASTLIHIVAPVLVAILDLCYPKRHEETLLWSIEEEGWHLHVCCSFLEWSVFFINVIYVATYHEEFKRIKIKRDEIVFKRRRNQHEENTTEPSGHGHLKFL